MTKLSPRLLETGALPTQAFGVGEAEYFTHPSGQDVFSAGHAVIEIELAEARPVARARQHLARSFRIARRIEFDGHVSHAERVEQFLPREPHHFGRAAARSLTDHVH